MKRRKLVFTLIGIGIGILLILTYVFFKKEIFMTYVTLREIIVSSKVLNPGFEAGLDKPSSWIEDGEGTWFVDRKDPFRGEKSMAATVSWRWLWQEMPARPNKYYILRAYVKSDITVLGDDYQNTFLTLECLDSEGKVIKEIYGIFNAVSSWELRELSVYSPPGTSRIRVKLGKRKGDGSVWFDEVTLTRSSSASMLNPGFEAGSEPVSWTEDLRGGWSTDEEDPFSGERCMEVSASWRWLGQEMPVRPDKYYILSAYVKSDIIIYGDDYQNTFLTLECLDSEGKVIKLVHGIVNAVSSWELRKSSVHTPQGTSRIRVKLAKRKGDGSVWFDEVRLVERSGILRIEWVRKISEDKPFFIFYSLMCFALIFSFVRLILKKNSSR